MYSVKPSGIASPPEDADVVGVAVPEGGTEAEDIPGERLLPNGFLINSVKNLRQLPFEGTK